MSKIGFIFDLDGTLIDSEQQIFDSVNSARLAHGFSVLSQDTCRALIGLPAEELFSDLKLDQNLLSNLVEDFREQLKGAIVKGNQLFPGVLDFLLKATELNVEFGIATNKPTNLALSVVRNSELSNFHFAVEGTGDCLPKPNPDTLLSCMNEIKAQRFLMFGDRKEDMIAARHANIIPIGISQTVHSKQFLKQSGAELVFGNFVEALGKIDEIVGLGGSNEELF